MFNPNLILLLIIPSSLFVLGLLVYLNNPKSLTNRLFFLMALTSAGSAGGVLASLLTTTSEGVFFWVKFTMFFACFVFPLMFLFTLAFPKDKYVFNKYLLIGEIIMMVVLPLSSIFNVLFVGAKYVNNSITVEPGPVIVLFIISQTLNFFGISIRLIQRMRSTVGTEREQFRYLTYGLVVTIIFISFFNVALVVIFNNTQYMSFGMLSFVILEGSIFYAITRHRLLDIRLVVARTVSFTLLVGLFATVYALMFAVASSLFITEAIQIRTVAISTFLALLMAITFQPIRRGLEKVTDKVFFRDHYDSSRLIYQLTLIMASTLQLGKLTHQMLIELLRQMHISRGAFILIKDNKIYEVAHEGYTVLPQIDEQKIIQMLGPNKFLIYEELVEEPYREVMRVMEAHIVASLSAEGEYMGLLVLGEKLSGDVYSLEDIKVLEILAPEAAVAIQNAKAYQEIKEFNITLQKEIDEATLELRTVNTKLKELDQLKDDFVSIASHELRTPMTAIKSYLWMALKKSDIPITDKMNRYLSRAFISTERLINLVNDMLNVSRIESGRIEIKPKEFNIINLTDEVVSMVSPKALEKQIKIEILRPQIPLVFADLDKVNQVLLNLLGNALKFTPQEGVITVSFFTDGKVVETSIKDNGVGISRDDMQRLFYKFGRLDNSYTAAAASGGTGLGLYICKNLIELMKGKIWAVSEGENKGTTFTFSLPAAIPEVIANAENYSKKPIGEAKILEPVTI